MCRFWHNIYRLSINIYSLHKTNPMRKRSVSILTLAVAGLLFTFFFILFRSTSSVSFADHHGGTSIDLPQSDTAFGGLFYTAQFNDSLPHYLYMRMEDSAKKVKAESEIENRGVSVNGMSMGIFGVYSMDRPQPYTVRERMIKELLTQMDNAEIAADQKRAATTNKDSIEKINSQLRDSLAYYKRIHEKKMSDVGQHKEKYYYVGLEGFKLDRDSKFFIQNETYNLAYVKWDTVSKNPNSNWKHGHYERKEIPVRYSAEDERVFIPVTHNQYNAMNALLYVICFGLLFAGLYFFFALPVRVLINISKGKAFDDQNVRNFNIMARAFLIMGLLSLVVPYILDCCLRSIVPHEFKRITFPENAWNNCWIFLVAIAVFITGKAFQKGNTLQKEQDLTI